ncbi:unnamed protein product [Cunninghamella blakesleeana]
MTVRNIRNHPYSFENRLQERQQHYNNNNNHISKYLTTTAPTTTTITTTNTVNINRQKSRYYTWLVFQHSTWVPFDLKNQSKLEQTHNLGGTFVDIEDSHFPEVKRVRIFPKSNYLSYLGVKYRLSRLQEPDAWLEPPDEMDINYHYSNLLSPSSSSSSSLSSSSTNSSLSSSPSNSTSFFSALLNNELSSRLLPIPKPSSSNNRYQLPNPYII